AVTFRLTGSNPGVGATPVVNFSGVGATMTADGGAGTDSLAFNGTAAADAINLSRVVGSTTLEVSGRQIVTAASFDSSTANAGDGNATVTVTGGAAAAGIPIILNGGSGNVDTLNNSTGVNTTYRPGTDRDAGYLVGSTLIQYTGIDAATVTFTAGGTTGTVDA